MSRIETNRPSSSETTPMRGISADRLARVLDRGGERPRSGSREGMSGGTLSSGGLVRQSTPFMEAPAHSALGARARDEQQESRHDGLPSVGSVQEADIAPLEALSADQLLFELSRIDLGLRDQKSQLSDPDLAQSFDIGLTMITETIRRLRLMHSGQDALVIHR